MLSERLDVDLLLTDHEESCDSTAQYHTLKNYNWIAEFDREGEDVVTYNLDSKKFLTALGDFWSIGIGAFSDIRSMQTDVCCVNIGIGHQLSHSKDSYVCIKTLRKQIERFLIFYDTYKNTEFKRDYRKPVDSYEFIANDDSSELCDVCGWEYGELVYGYRLCYHCFMEIFERALV